VAPQQPERPDEPQTREDGAAGGGEDAATSGIRACERSAQRAAAVAATEDFHPLRLRPYVAEPGGEPGGTTARPPVTADPDGPATADLGLFPAMYSGLEYAEDEPAAGAGYAETATAVAVRGRHRRRRRRVVIMAAAVAASALAAGAVAVTGQVMGDDQGGADRALPDLSTSMPDVELPADAGPATATIAPPVTHGAVPDPVGATRTPSHPPSASASPSPTASTTTAPAAATTGVASPAAAPVRDPASATAPPSSTPPTGHTVAAAAVPVLELGDTGSAVADLQRRLTEMRIYHGPVDGVFDHQVQQAVATFQIWFQVSDSAGRGHNGVYGPNTRAVLERQTS
jgi:Putative peptidoglycan binding domain